MRSFLLLLALAALAGCATVQPEIAADEVRQSVEAGAPDLPVAWRTDSNEDARADAAVEALLADSLSQQAAVQIALLNNHRLQATYEDLGVAQAALVQAGLLSNPVFGGSALFPLEESGPANLAFSAALEFLDVVTIPLRRRIARSEYEAARLRVTEAVLDLAARTQMAYVDAQAARARLAVERLVVANAEAGHQAALLLREAGNTPALDFLNEQARYEQARLDLLAAEADVTLAHEALVRRMGLSGSSASFTLPGTLPAVPDSLALDGLVTETGTLDVAELERRTLASSLALDAARQDVVTVGQRFGLAVPTSILPDLEVGAELEREEGDWWLGPEVEVVVPLFDQGQARRAGLQAELRRRRALYLATAVDVRSTARVVAARLAAAHRIALHYQTVVVPLRVQITQQTLRQYNAMQIGVFGLLDAQRQEAEAARAAVDAAAGFWRARTDLDALLWGRMPALDAALALPSDAPSDPSASDAH